MLFTAWRHKEKDVIGKFMIAGLGFGSTVVAVSRDGTPDLSSLDPGLFCRTSSTCRLQTCPSSR